MISIGRHTYCVTPIVELFSGEANLRIGKFCSIARGCIVFLGGNHRSDFISTFPFDLIFNSSALITSTKGDIEIGNDVWIGQEVMIMSGVTIGDGAVIGARSVVTKNIPSYAIACGNPAEVKKFRFKPLIVEKLLELKWWDWSDEKIKMAVPFLSSRNVEELLNFEGESKK